MQEFFQQLTAIAGLILILFTPGFSLSFLLFQYNELDRLERFSLASISSIAISGVLGSLIILLNNSFNLNLFFLILFGLSALFALSSIIRHRYQHSQTKDNLYKPRLHLKKIIILNRNALVISLILCVVLIIVYSGAKTTSDINSTLINTEFYVVPDLLAKNPELKLDDQGQISIPVEIRPGLDSKQAFTLEAYVDGSKVWEVAPIHASQNSPWYGNVIIELPNSELVSIRLYLYSGSKKEPIRQLTLWLNS